MARQSGKLDEILNAIVIRLRDQISDFNSSNCYLSMDPDAIPQSPGEFTCVVAPTSGSFEEAFLDGGGQQQCTSAGGFVAKVHSPVQLDDLGRDVEFLTHDSLGLIELMRLVLKALVAWSPKDDLGNELTRDPLLPANFAFTRTRRSLGAVEITFHLSHDWDLS